MGLRIAINGYGRIGRCFVRALSVSPERQRFSLVAINEPAALESMLYLTRFDSTHGPFPGRVDLSDGGLAIDDAEVLVFHQTSPAAVDWRPLEVDLLIEASGAYATRAELQGFLDAGCRRVLLSNPGVSAAEVDQTIVFGFNQQLLTGQERIVSAASCTTNAVVPILALLDAAFGVDHAVLTTLHSVMNDQPLIDGYHHADLHRTRSAMQSMIPVSTGLARGVARLLPALAERVESKAIRVPVVNVSAIDMVLTLNNSTEVSEVNRLLQSAAQAAPGLLAYTSAPHASVDFNHSPYSAIVDGGQTRMSGSRLLNLLIWFDNEWGFANRMIDVMAHWAASIQPQ